MSHTRGHKSAVDMQAWHDMMTEAGWQSHVKDGEIVRYTKSGHECLQSEFGQWAGLKQVKPDGKQMKNSKPVDRRKAQVTIEQMAHELGDDRAFSIMLSSDGECSVTWWGAGVVTAFGDTLDDAFINLLHKLAGTTEAPF